ncbi:MAG: hypothetical protein ISR96_00900 [Nitrospira sp.]|nr:hypothetical protein [Candidatus Brocadiales bacterium]MBL7048073.1 hypothetical protein [Nitrospira sp.]
MAKQNCWEIKKCGREQGGDKSEELGVCPAATLSACDGINSGNNAGRICWAIAGTFCGGRVQGDFAQKSVSCMSCEVFKEIKAEEGSRDFVLLKPGQGFCVSVK